MMTMMHFAVVVCFCLFSLLLFPAMSSSSTQEQQVADDMIKEPIKKTIYVIRHAESEENRRLAALSRCGGSIGKFQLPSSSDFKAGSGFLLNIMGQVDSDLSEAGKAQIKTIAAKLQQDNFVESAGVQLIAHSPLQRAKQTCKGMLGCDSDDSECDYSSVNRVVELPLLIEKTPAEWIPGNSKSLATRIQKLEEWLIEQPESTILLVGHSQLFKAMLGLSFKLGNCDVWKATLEAKGGDATMMPVVVLETTDTTPKAVDNAQYKLPRGWSDLRRLYVGATATKVGEDVQEEELPN
jgi:broad specificity phosphatase PhoE